MKIAIPFLAIVAAINCVAQTPAFDVASVRLFNPAGAPGASVHTSPDSLTIHGASLRDCIQVAYHMPLPQQVTGPDWLNDVRLDIVAKAAGPVGEPHLYLMLQTLLAERLGVRAHIEQKEMSVYAITLVKGGPKFSESTTEGPPARRAFDMQRFSMSDVATWLSHGFGGPVVDATGLKGRYDLHLDMAQYAPVDGSQPGPMDAIGIMITALQEQLGLKIESRKDLVDVLVVDHAEKTPTEN